VREQSDSVEAPQGRRKRNPFALLMAIVLIQGTETAWGAPTDEIQVYDASIAAVGIFNLTWHNNFTASGNSIAAFPGAIAAEHSLNGVTEWAYGVTPWFEAGLYIPLYTLTGSGSLTYNGFKLRTLFVVPEAQSRHFFYGVNFEYSDNSRHWDPKAFTAEVRPIVGWRFGSFDLIFNPILDYDSSGFSGLHFAPASRLAAHVNHDWAVAAELYDDFGPVKKFLPSSAQSHQLFAVVDHNVGKTAIEFGAGYGLTQGSDRAVLKLILSRDLN
jgi:hypothetical protein